MLRADLSSVCTWFCTWHLVLHLIFHLILHLAPGWPPAFVQHLGFTAKHSRVVAAPYFNLSPIPVVWPIRPENEAAICTCPSKIVQRWNYCIIWPFEQSRIRPGWATRQSIYLSNLLRKRFAPLLLSNGATNQLKERNQVSENGFKSLAQAI